MERIADKEKASVLAKSFDSQARASNPNPKRWSQTLQALDVSLTPIGIVNVLIALLSDRLAEDISRTKAGEGFIYRTWRDYSCHSLWKFRAQDELLNPALA